MTTDWIEEMFGKDDPQERIDGTIEHVEYWHKLIAAVESAIKDGKQISFGNDEYKVDDECIYLDIDECDCRPLTARHFLDLPNRVAKLRAEIEDSESS